MRKFAVIMILLSLAVMGTPRWELHSIDDLKKKYPDLKTVDEQAVNLLGYQLLQEGETEEAIEVFVLNTRLYPESWNTFDSLGEACEAARRPRDAIAAYRKSLALNPRNLHGKRALGRLEYPELAGFAGVYQYYHDPLYRDMQVCVEDGFLILDFPRQNPVRLIPSPGDENRFAVRGESQRVFLFLRNETGEVRGIREYRGATTVEYQQKSLVKLKERLTPAELREDFQQFKSHLLTTPENPHEFTGKSEFNRAFRRAERRLSVSLPLGEFYRILVPLKALLGCGHTHLDYPPRYPQHHQFPLVMAFAGHRCYVTRTLQPERVIPLFGQVLAINGIRARRIIRILRKEISADGHNDAFRTAALNGCFQYYHANHYGTPREYTIRIRDPRSGRAGSYRVPAVPCRKVSYSNRTSGTLDRRMFPAQGACLVSVPSWNYYGDRNAVFFSFVDKVMSEMRREEIQNLIIDLRGNGGGDPYCAAYLLAKLIDEPTRYFSESYPHYEKLYEPVLPAENAFEGTVFILTDGACFSTSGHFCALVRYHRLGILIGEETGGTYTCNGAVRRFHLKHSRILLKVSSRSYAAAVSGFSKKRGVIPDHRVSTGIEDRRRQRDPVLEYTLRLIESRNPGPGF